MDASTRDGYNSSPLDGSELEKGRDETLARIRTAGSVQISAELFEKLYLSPPNHVKGQFRSTFGNPTPMGLVGFLVSLMPLSCDLMGWRGAGGFGASSLPVYFFMGGILMLLSCIFEWALGNSFPATVFSSFGTFWLALAGTLSPSFGAYAFYAPADAASTAEGLQTREFNAGLGFWLLAMALLATVYLVCSLRTNIVFVMIFLSLIPALCMLTGAVWLLADDYEGNAQVAAKLEVGTGAALLFKCAAGWYLVVAILLAILDFPFQLPVGDLSGLFKGLTKVT